MKNKNSLLVRILVSLTLLLIVVTQFNNPALAVFPTTKIEFDQAGSYAEESRFSKDAIQLLSADEQKVVFEVAVPWGLLSLQEIQGESRDYVSVSLPGWMATSQPGAPQLPYNLEQIAVPFAAEVRINVVPGEVHTYALSAPILPAGTPSIAPEMPNKDESSTEFSAVNYQIIEDPFIYDGDQAYPNTLAEQINDGLLRQHRLVSIAFYPLQYHPGKAELTVYESLQVQVFFDGPGLARPQTSMPDSEAYQGLLAQTILNAESARNWQTPTDSVTSSEVFQSDRDIPWAPPEPG